MCREGGGREGRGDGYTGKDLHSHTIDCMFAVKKLFQKS